MITSEERKRIEEAIHRELCRSFDKHGDWTGKNIDDMADHILDEFLEVGEAIDKNDTWGEHGMITELAQTAACCQKMMMQLIRRET